MVLFLILLLVSLVHGHPSDCNKIPNGWNVFYNGNHWPMVAHMNKTGSLTTNAVTGAPSAFHYLNPFGSDYKDVYHENWTLLCPIDSDLDGRTNGEELGDPDCVWKYIRTNPMQPYRKAGITHPGFPDVAANWIWKMEVSFHPKTLLYQAAVRFAKRVFEITEGVMEIHLVNGSNDATSHVLNGQYEACHTALYHASDVDPTFALIAATPFSMNIEAQKAWRYWSAKDRIDTFLAKFGLVALPGGSPGPQMGGWWRRKIERASDLDNVNMHICGLGAEVMKKLKANATCYDDISEVAARLVDRTLDSAECTGPYDDIQLKLDVLPHYYYPSWWENSLLCNFVFNKTLWDSLPLKVQAAMIAAANEVDAATLENYETENAAALEVLKKRNSQDNAERNRQNNVEFKPFRSDFLSDAKRHTDSVLRAHANDNEDFKNIWNSMKSFMFSSVKYTTFTEYAYETVMVQPN